MDQDGTFVPAWRRLGLKLKNDSQSGDTVSDVADPQKARQRRGESGGGGGNIANQQLDHVVEAAGTGRPLTLGKRKHQDGPAEELDQTSKRSKAKRPTTQENDESVAVVAQTTAVVAPAPVSNAPKSTGDPNYRRKKEKRPAKKWIADSENGDVDDASSLLPSTESDFPNSLPPKTPKSARQLAPSFNNEGSDTLHSSPSRTDRRKSVTFTPDTKTVDGNSASNLFKKWVVEQKGGEGDFTSAEVAQFAPPPKSHPANQNPESQPVNGEAAPKPKKQKKAKTSKGDQETPTTGLVTKKLDTPAEPSSTNSSKGKKDFSLYTSYLAQFHDDRDNWKFNKAKQNTVLDNALSIFRIPNEYMDALVSYVQGLQGAAIVNRLKERCEDKLKQIEKEETKSKRVLTDAEDRKIAEWEALDEELSKGKRRRQTNVDLEEIIGHPFEEGYVRRLERRRAQALLDALKLAAPKAPSESLQRAVREKDDVAAPLVRNSRKRKSRTDISSDESSSSDSSSESSDEPSSDDPSSDESSSEEEDSNESSSEEESSDDSGAADEDDNKNRKDDSDSDDGNSGSDSESADDSGNQSGDDSSDDSSDSSHGN